MSRLGWTTAILVSALLLALTSLAGHATTLPGHAAAQLPTWTPVDVTITALTPSPTSETPSPTPITPSPTPITPSPTPITPSPTPITPSPTPITPSPTPITPSPTPITPTPSVTAPTVTPRPSNTPRPEGPGQPAPNPACQSAVEGNVLEANGQHVTGATVVIKGSDWSRGIMTDDNGRYGFAGLCAGTATLQAFLASGQAGSVMTVSLSGNNSLRQDLSFGTSSTATAPATQAVQQTPQQAPTGTPQAAGMPVTGYAGWLLAGGAALGALLLLSAGGRRALQAYERARSRE